VGPGAKWKEATAARNARVISERHNICGAYSIDIPRCFLGNARVMMSIVYAAARAYCLPTEWTGTLPARWPGRRPSANKMDRYAAARPRGLTSRSARWLTSRAVGHVAASGLRLSGEQRRTPDPRLALIKAWVFFVLESRDPAVSGPDPT
jgi:hypothetical protein